MESKAKLTFEQALDKTVLEAKANLTFEQALDRTGFGLYSILMVVVAGCVIISQMCTAYGTTIIIPASACELRTTVVQRGALAAVPVIGLIMGGLFWGYLGDRYGRKPTLLVSLLSAATVNAAASISVNWVMLMALQFLATLLSAGQYFLSMTLVSESVPLGKRNVMVLMVASIYFFSQGTMAVLAIPIIPLKFSYYLPALNIFWNSWRTLMVTYSAPSLISAACLCFMCESPKFLFVKGKESQAKSVLRRIHKLNNFGTPGDLQIDGLSVAIEQYTERTPARYSQIATLFRPPLLKKLTIIGSLFILQQVNAFMVWLPTIANQFTQIIQTGEGANLTLCSIIRASFNVPQDPNIAPCSLNTNALMIVITVGVMKSVVNGLLSLVVDRVGRRNTAMVITSTCAALGVAVNLIPNAIGSVLAFLLFLSGMLLVGIYSAIAVASFPTQLRALAMAVTMTAGRLGTFVSIQILNVLLGANCEAGFYLFSTMLACSTIIAGCLIDDRVLRRSTNLE